MCLIDRSESVQFWVIARHDVHVTLSSDKASTDNIEISIGESGDTISVLRSAHGQRIEDALDVSRVPGRLHDYAWKPFWITWENDYIKVGEGRQIGRNTFLRGHSTQDIYYFGMSTGNGAFGNWAFGCK